SISLLPIQVAASLSIALGAVAIALAAIGLYGVMSYLARRRTREIGIRMALGAQPSSVIWLVARPGLRWTVTAIVIGLAGSLAATRVLRTLLYGVGSIDPLVFGVVPFVLAATACAACWFPGRWASRVDPLTALRVE